MLVYISIIYCIAYFGIQYAYLWGNRKLKKTDYYFMILFFIALIYIGYHLIPNESDDLYRHYGVVNWYRNGRREINIQKNILPLSGTEQLYVYQLICWFISLQEKNAYLQVIYLGIDFFCVIKIIILFTSKVKVNRDIMALYILIYFTLIPFFCSYSGLRFSAVCHIMGLGGYKYYYENDRLIKLIVLYIICFLIHPATGIYLMIQIWYECTKNSRLTFLIIGLWGISVKVIAELLQYIPISQIRYAGKKLYFYFCSYDTTIDVRRTLAQTVFLIFIIMLLLTDAISYRKIKRGLIRLYIIIALLGIGSMNAMFLDRMITMIGPVSILYLYYVFRKTRYKFILYLGFGIWSILMNVYYTITVFTYLKLVV